MTITKIHIMKLKTQIMLAALTCSAVACQEYTPVKTFTEAADPVTLSTSAEEDWNAQKNGLNAAWGS